MILAVFFTRGVSLQDWVNAGLFEREKLIYNEHLKSGEVSKIYWLTYGTEDARVAETLKTEGRLHSQIFILPMPSLFGSSALGCWMYSFLLPFVYGAVLRRVNVFKTNQMNGSWAAVISKLLFRKPLLLRTGYTQTLFSSGIQRFFYTLVEYVAYGFCNIASVSSEQDKSYIVKRYAVNELKIITNLNYINTELFKPNFEGVSNSTKLVFVGRLNDQKNLFNLIDAVGLLGCDLDVYGDGELKAELVSFIKKRNLKVSLKGVVPNNELPSVLNNYQYFILPSLYEGMPKTLLEAMSCGLVCIGSNVPGINEVIEDGVNGYLSKSTATDELIKSISIAMTSDNRSIYLNARKYILEKHSLRAHLEKEKVIFLNCQ